MTMPWLQRAAANLRPHPLAVTAPASDDGLWAYSVGTVPPSIRYSDPAIDADRGDAMATLKIAHLREIDSVENMR